MAIIPQQSLFSWKDVEELGGPRASGAGARDGARRGVDADAGGRARPWAERLSGASGPELAAGGMGRRPAQCRPRLPGERLLPLPVHWAEAGDGLRRLRGEAWDAEVSLPRSSLRTGLPRSAAVCGPGGGADQARGGPPGIHACGSFQLQVASSVCEADCAGASKQPPRCQLRLRAALRAWSREDEAASGTGAGRDACDRVGPRA